MNIIFKLLLRGLAVFITAYILKSGIILNDFVAALVVAVVLAIGNTIVKPILVILTLPVTLLTFGLFTLVINGLIVLLASYLVKGFEVKNILWAILFSIVLSLISTAINWIAK